ncbi:Uncharacterised protein [uncultured archaeon]|nr:Uncharacterised protein [uncultured archaeon]
MIWLVTVVKDVLDIEPLDAVIIVVPYSNAVNIPLELIVPAVVLLEVHVGVAEYGLPNWSFGEAVNC